MVSPDHAPFGYTRASVLRAIPAPGLALPADRKLDGMLRYASDKGPTETCQWATDTPSHSIAARNTLINEGRNDVGQICRPQKYDVLSNLKTAKARRATANCRIACLRSEAAQLICPQRQSAA